MSIKSVCNTEVVTIDKNSVLREVASLMQKYHVGSVIVTEGFNGKRVPAGIITDRDIALCVGSSPKPEGLPVESVMQSQPLTIKTSDGIYETIAKMKEHGIKRLPVVSENGSLFGIICADDLLGLMGEEINNLAKISETQVKKEQGIRMPTERQVNL
jgi:CBS domain-containing protein